MKKVLSQERQAQQFDMTLAQRLNTLLPGLMERHNVSLWVVMCREYNEDPVYTTLVPFMTRTARRLTILLFHRQPDGSVRRCSIGPDVGELYEVIPLGSEERMEVLRRTIEEMRPQNIALDISDTCAMADGLSKSLYDQFAAAVGRKYMSRVVSAELLVVDWLQTRLPQEMTRYQAICETARQIIDDAFSSKVITPGVTTTSEVEWFMMDAVAELGLECWFTPDVDLQRPGHGGRVAQEIILPGDLLHCDFGIRYMGLCTDTQRLFYVPHPGETEPPAFLKAAYDNSSRFMEIVAENYREGRTGDEILVAAYEQARGEGLDPQCYCHPVGFYGHGAGPLVGLYSQPGPIGGRGEYVLRKDSCFALELNTKVPLPEWGLEKLWVMREETVLFRKDGELEYLMEGSHEFKIVR